MVTKRLGRLHFRQSGEDLEPLLSSHVSPFEISLQLLLRKEVKIPLARAQSALVTQQEIKVNLPKWNTDCNRNRQVLWPFHTLFILAGFLLVNKHKVLTPQKRRRSAMELLTYKDITYCILNLICLKFPDSFILNCRLSCSLFYLVPIFTIIIVI